MLISVTGEYYEITHVMHETQFLARKSHTIKC